MQTKLTDTIYSYSMHVVLAQAHTSPDTLAFSLILRFNSIGRSIVKIVVTIAIYLSYSGLRESRRGERLVSLLFSSVLREKVWRMNISAKGLLIVTIPLFGWFYFGKSRTRFLKLAMR